MGTASVFFLGMLYLITGVIYIFIEVSRIRKYKRTSMMLFIRLMYILIYSIVPTATYFDYYFNGYLPYNIYLNSSGLQQGYLLFILSVIGYFFLNLGYKVNTYKKNLMSTTDITNKTNPRNLTLSGIIIFIIGFIGLYLWTKPYGSLFGIIPYASDIRAGREILDNPFSFMKELAPLLMYSSYIFIAVNIDKKKKMSLLQLTLILLSVFWTIVYMISNDGRMTFVAFFLIIILGIMRRNELKSQQFIKKNWMKLLIISSVGFYLMSISDQIMDFIRGEDTAATSNVVLEKKEGNIISNELGYTIKSGQVALTAYQNGESGNRIFIDMINGLTAWIPARFVPSDLQFMNLYEFNTLLGNGRYTQPTDFLSMIIYDLGYIGIIIIPLIFGMIIRIVESIFSMNKNLTYYNLLYGLIVFNLARIIAYADLEIISRGFFYIFIGHLIVKILNRINFNFLNEKSKQYQVIDYNDFTEVK